MLILWTVVVNRACTLYLLGKSLQKFFEGKQTNGFDNHIKESVFPSELAKINHKKSLLVL